MKNKTLRGSLISAGALALAIAITFALALLGATPAFAQAQPVPDKSAVTITKLAQPDELGSPASGEAQNVSGGIEGVRFEFYLVPGTEKGGANDIGTNAGQEYAGSLTPETVTVGGLPAITTGATGSNGVTREENVPRGLYLVKENPESVPAGVTAAAPFLLSVPLTNPTDKDRWLDEIFVYPKNSQITAKKEVENAGQLVIGSDIIWTITADISKVANLGSTGADDQFIAPDYFRIDDTLMNDELRFVGAAVKIGNVPLAEPGDYEIVSTNPNADSTSYQIVFSEAGRLALANAVNEDPNAQVTVEITTTVLRAGEINNSANVYPNQNSVDQDQPLPIDPATVKYGAINIEKKSTDGTVEDLSGAQFRIYASESDALAGTNPLNVDAPASREKQTGEGKDIWTTDAAGKLAISGLRYSGFADGTEFDAQDSRYQKYYLVEVKALEGHQLLAEPIEVTIFDTAQTKEIRNQANSGGFELPLTGGSGTVLLTIVGIAILGTVVFLARRRSNDSA